jgi:hypothetical protein
VLADALIPESKSRGWGDGVPIRSQPLAVPNGSFIPDREAAIESTDRAARIGDARLSAWNISGLGSDTPHKLQYASYVNLFMIYNSAIWEKSILKKKKKIRNRKHDLERLQILMYVKGRHLTHSRAVASFCNPELKEKRATQEHFQKKIETRRIKTLDL